MKRIPYLAGIRGIAILMVFFAHAIYLNDFFTQLGVFKTILFNSHLGVMIFFVLSGYLITTLLIKEKERTGEINVKHFYLRRALRIFPVFYLYLFVVTLLYWFGKVKISGYLLIFSSLYLNNYMNLFPVDMGDAPDYRILGHFWTLSLEEQFYLVWPTLVILVGLLNMKKIMPFILCAYPLMRITTYLLFPAMRGQIGMMLHTMGDCIFWGCFAALIEKFNRPAVDKMITAFMEKRIYPFSLFVVLFIICPIGSYYLKGMFSLTIGFTIEGICISTLLLFILNGKPEYMNFLNNKILMYIGLLSYSIYIWHVLFLRTDTILNIFPLNIIATGIVAYCSYHYIEMPILKLKNKLK
jgi:peptidoglycan/LPS O-acetylase OafA/YrhL